MNRRVLNRDHSGVHFCRLGKWLLAGAVFLWVSAVQAQTRELIDAYMGHWKDFYPSSAFSEGKKSAAWRFEDFSRQRISDWLLFNQQAEKNPAIYPRQRPVE